MKSSGERRSTWPLIVGTIVGILAVTAGPALAALTFSGTNISGDSGVAIDSSSTISIGTSTATGIWIGSHSATTTFPGTVTFAGNLGIGTANPQFPFDDTLASGGNILNLQSNNSYVIFQGTSYRNSTITHVDYDGVGYRGTLASPLAIRARDSVTALRAEAYSGVPGGGSNGDGTNEISTLDLLPDEDATTTTGLATQGGAFIFSTENGALLNQAQINNGFPLNGNQIFTDTRFYIGSNGNLGLGTGAINCNLDTTCFINEDVEHDMPTQVYFGSTNGGTAYYGGATGVSYSTKVVLVPGTNQSTIPLLTVGSSTFSATGGSLGIGTAVPSTTLQVVGASSTIRIGTSALPGCLELGNSDGSAGMNYITVLNGALTATTTKPSACE